jgi:L-glyceraldehyde 3-phosphate reductase
MMTASTPEEGTAFRGMPGRRLGTSGIVIPRISLGCWNNFGAKADEDECRQLVFSAFDQGVTHFDLANNYGPPPGSAEERFGKILNHLPRDEIIISTKAGYLMWEGHYGNWGSRKHLLASLDQSLRRLQVEYVDIFYHHRPDSATRLDESLGALDTAVGMGKALYPGISNYNADQTRRAVSCAEANGLAPLLVNQSKYNMFQRDIEDELLSAAAEAGMGVIAFSPLAQGLLTNRYLTNIPPGSRASTQNGYSGALNASHITDAVLTKVRALQEVAFRRGQSLAQLAMAWAIRDRDGGQTAGAIVGASSVEQLSENLLAADGPALSEDELNEIDSICLRASTAD